MKIRKIGLLMVFAALNPLGGSARGIADIVRSLENSGCTNARIAYSVTLPQNDTDITYDITASTASDSVDPLSPCRYLISWSLPTPKGMSEGFSAYFDGNHYRFRDQRLQEYHVTWDSVPFMAANPDKGVQAAAQFAELLPPFVGRSIASTLNDSTYIYKEPVETVFNGQKALKLSASRIIAGVTAMERDYIFDAATLLPLRIDTESNPGSITEQSILADYTYGAPDCPELTEPALIARFPEVFEKYRISNFRIENLPGTKLPAFSLRSPDGSRFTHALGEPLPSPAIVVLLDTSAGFNSETVEAVRSAADGLPYQATVIWAFAGNNADSIEEIIPSTRQGEHIVTGSRSLARDCGVTAMPVVIMTDKEGTVKKVAVGFNKDLADVVLQNMALID